MAVEGVPLPNSYESMYQRAESLVRSGQPDAAAEVLERIQKRLGSLSEATLRENAALADFAYRTGMSLAELLMGEGRYDEALVAIERMHRFAPRLAPVISRQAALALAAKGDLEAAQTRLEALTGEHPDESFIWLGLGEVLLAKGLHAEAADALDRALDRADDGTVRAIIEHRRFVLHRTLGALEQAQAAWDRMRAADASIASYRAHELYDLLLDSGEADKLRHLLRQDESKSRAEYYRGLLDHAAGDFAAGTARWEALLKNSPYEDRLGVLEWAQAALRLGKTDEALNLLVAASQDGTSPRALLLLAIGAARRGRVEQALQMVARGTRLLRTYVPRAERYGRKEWELLTSLVDNRELWRALEPYFDSGRAEA